MPLINCKLTASVMAMPIFKMTLARYGSTKFLSSTICPSGTIAAINRRITPLSTNIRPQRRGEEIVG